MVSCRKNSFRSWRELGGIAGIIVASVLSIGSTATAAEEPQFTRSFGLSSLDFQATGFNRYLPLQPGVRLFLSGVDEGDVVDVYLSVSHETYLVQGVETRVMIEKEWVNGELCQVNYQLLAFCEQMGAVFLFGEIATTAGAADSVVAEDTWLAGVDGQAGLLLPGMPLLGARYYQEVVPGIAMDRSEILSTNKTVSTPAGTFEHCLEVEETSDLEDEKEIKIWAPGVGPIQDGNLKLVWYETPGKFRK